MRFLQPGTRSVLFGAHQIFLHPLFLAYAWYKLWGFKKVEDYYLGEVSLWDPRLWVAFFVHDLGYWGMPNMDGEEGEYHPLWGAQVMTSLFDMSYQLGFKTSGNFVVGGTYLSRRKAPKEENDLSDFGPWGNFVLYHSRFLAKREETPYSALCVADKLSPTLEPRWLYLLKVKLSGEIKEYMSIANNPDGKYGSEQASVSPKERPWRLCALGLTNTVI